MENYNEKLNWRYATKKFNPEKSLSQEDVDYLQKSIQLSASSYGLQPYEVFVVTDKETKEKLKEAGVLVCPSMVTTRLLPPPEPAPTLSQVIT